MTPTPKAAPATTAEKRARHAAEQRRYQARHREEHTERQRLLRRKNPKPFTAATRRYRIANRHKANAGRTLRRAVRRGVVMRPDCCSACGRLCKPHGHHDDYAKPLSVRWLCSQCHFIVHGKLSWAIYEGADHDYA